MSARVMLFPAGDVVDLSRIVEAAGYTVRVSPSRAVAIAYPSREIPAEKEGRL